MKKNGFLNRSYTIGVLLAHVFLRLCSGPIAELRLFEGLNG